MSRGAIFWGLVLIIIGSLALLDNANIITFNFWQIIGPVFLVSLGIWILLGSSISKLEKQQLSIPLDGFDKAVIHISYGAGRLKLNSTKNEANLLVGDFDGGVSYQKHKKNEMVDLSLSVPTIPWLVFRPLDWNLSLNPNLPISIDANIGAAESILNFEDLQLKDLRLSTGASSTTITLPSRSGKTQAVIKAGAASVSIKIPSNVAGKIRGSVGLGSLSVDRNRFPWKNGVYCSPDYEYAENKIDLRVEIGLGSVDLS